MCIAIHNFDSEKFLSAPGLAWQAGLQKNKAKLDVLTDVDMLSTVEKV